MIRMHDNFKSAIHHFAKVIGEPVPSEMAAFVQSDLDPSEEDLDYYVHSALCSCRELYGEGYYSVPTIHDAECIRWNVRCHVVLWRDREWRVQLIYGGIRQKRMMGQ